LKNGFSLIELLIVLAIVGILTSLTYPSYRDYTTRAHRTDGQTALLSLANRMEQYYADKNTYQGATLDSRQSTDAWYTLCIRDATASGYLLQATPTKTQAINDTLCQSLTFNHMGTKGITSGPAGEPSGRAINCW
jgi:type IV pilus assembly protein PilE